MAISIPGDKSKQPEARTSRGRRIKSRDMAFFLGQLAMMLEVGISISKAIATIAQQTENHQLKTTLQSMADAIEEGRQLSDAMAAYPRVFQSVYVNIVRSGEACGTLNQVLNSIIEIQEKNQGIQGQLKAALIYPCLLIGLAAVVTVFALVMILPKFTTFFEGKLALLPPSTRGLIFLSDLMQNHWLVCLVAAAGTVGAVYLYTRSALARAHRDWALVHLPLVGRFSNNVYTGLFLRILGNMLQSGVSLKEALSICANSMNNRYYNEFIAGLHEGIRQGQNFSTGFTRHPQIQGSVKQMIFVGEETGKLPRVMLRLADYYEQEIQKDFKVVTALIEPVSLMFIGVVVWVLVSAIILPMFRLAGAVG